MADPYALNTKPPSANEQIRFLVNLQRILDEGQFVATYKYALLLALADISVESGDDTGAALSIPTTTIAEEFIQLYWRQTVPYPSAFAQVLQQNTGKQAAIVNAICSARSAHADSLSKLSRSRSWNKLGRRVAKVVQVMPLWKLQKIGSDTRLLDPIRSATEPSTRRRDHGVE